MIYIFRKEMKKWHAVLWVVLASLALGSGVSIFFSSSNSKEITIATVNGKPVFFNTFRRSLAEIQERLNSIRYLARAYGMSEASVINMYFGASDPQEIALDLCVKDLLMDSVKDQFNIVLDKEWFKQELIKSMPHIAQDGGRVNIEMYQRYVQQLAFTPAEFEKKQADAFQRELVQKFVTHAGHVPNFMVRESFNQSHDKKSFHVVKITADHFVTEVKKTGVTHDELEEFFNTNKELYRVKEERQAQYVELSGESYMQHVMVDDQTVRNFYEKNKSTMFRITPKIKVRNIVVKTAKEASTIRKSIIDKEDTFANLAKKLSINKDTAAQGGLVDFFAKGTYDTDFEKAAFRLQDIDALSPVIKTKDGYELIQLVERIAASEKPFESVRQNIEKNLKTKKALASLRSDLETVVRLFREDKNAIVNFAKKNNVSLQTTPWLIEHDNKLKGSVLNTLSEKIFSQQKRQSSAGYFSHHGSYVLYELVGIKKSALPALADVRGEVEKDYVQETAQKLARVVVKDARIALLENKTDLEAVAKANGGHVIIIADAKKSDAIKSISDAPGLKDQLFTLSDKGQVLSYNEKNTYFLAQLTDTIKADNAEFEKDRLKIAGSLKYNAETQLASAFIASLYRNAKIEVNRPLLDKMHIE